MKTLKTLFVLKTCSLNKGLPPPSFRETWEEGELRTKEDIEHQHTYTELAFDFRKHRKVKLVVKNGELQS